MENIKLSAEELEAQKLAAEEEANGWGRIVCESCNIVLFKKDGPICEACKKKSAPVPASQRAKGGLLDNSSQETPVVE